MVVSIMATSMIHVIDTTIANVALPHIQGSLSTTQDQVAWVLTSYIVTTAIFTPTTGWLSGRLGRRNLLMIGIGGFTLASVMCGTANSLTELVIYRVLQGAFGAALVPVAQSLMLDSFTREHHGQAMALWGLGVMVGPVLGPTLGGYLTEMYGWRWIFYINLPIGLFALVGISLSVKKIAPQRDRKFDWFGFSMLALAVGALQLMIDRGQSEDWFASTEIIIEAIVAGLCLYMFATHLMTSRNPFFSPAILKDRNFVIGCLTVIVAAGILHSTLVLIPPFMQDLLGYPVLATGIILAPRGLATAAAMLVVARIVGRIHAPYLVIFGMFCNAWSMWEMSFFTLEVGTWPLIWTGLIQGFGLGFIFVPLTTVTFSTLADKFRADGTAIYRLVWNVGGGIGISALVAVLVRSIEYNHTVLVEHINPYNEALRNPAIARVWDFTDPLGLIALDAEVWRQAAMIAYLNDFILIVVVTFIAIPVLFLFRRPRNRASREAA